MRAWSVGGALIRHGTGLLLVGNRRRDDSVDWTPPGGVIDPGEDLLTGLAREVREETGLVVTGWAGRRYTVSVRAPGLGWHLRVEAWEVAEYTGEVLTDDPDGIVEEVRHADLDEALTLLATSPPWVQQPVVTWLDGGGHRHPSFSFELRGTDRRTAEVVRVR